MVFEANDSYWNRDAMNITKITWYYQDGNDPLKPYDDFMAGTLDRCGLGPSTIKKCQEDGNFDKYAIVSELEATTRVGYLNLNRQSFALFNDPTGCVSEMEHGSVETLDRDNEVYVADATIVDDAARTHVAMNNHNFRLALTMGPHLLQRPVRGRGGQGAGRAQHLHPRQLRDPGQGRDHRHQRRLHHL